MTEPFAIEVGIWAKSASPRVTSQRLQMFFDLYPELPYLSAADIHTWGQGVEIIMGAHTSWWRKRREPPPAELPLGHYPHAIAQYSEDVEVEAALFDFYAPNIAGCQVTVESSSKSTKEATWTLSAGGSSASGGLSVSMSRSSSFVAGPGERKRLFVMVAAQRLYRFHIYHGIPDASPRRDVVVRPSRAGRATSALAVRSLDADQPCSSLGNRLERYPLARDQSAQIARYQYNYEQANSGAVQVGISYKGVTSNTELRGRLENGLTLKMDLRSGRNYVLHSVPGGKGIAWAVE